MKKMFKISLTVFALFSVMFAFAITANAETEKDFEYKIVDEKAVITAYTGKDANVIIPDIIGGKVVAGVTVNENQSFSTTNISSVSIPATVTAIDKNSLGFTYSNGIYSKLNNFVVFGGKSNTVASSYASNNGFKFFSNNLGDYSVSLSSTSYEYTGAQKKPTLTLKYGSNVLNSAYYSVDYSSNVNAGTATATAKGEFALKDTSAKKTFSIVAKNVSNLSTSITGGKKIYTGKALTPNVVVKHGKTVLTNNTDYTVQYTNNVKCGIAYAKITGKHNYKGTVSVKFYIYPGTVSRSYISSVSSYGVTLKWNAYASGTGYKIFKYDSKSKSYKVCATVKGIGTTSYTVKGLSSYSSYSFKVAPYIYADKCDRISSQGNKIIVYTRPAQVNLRYVTKSGTKLRVEWAKTKSDGYEIIYSTDKNFKKNVKRINVSASSTIRTISGVNKKSVYYVKIRAKRVIKGKGSLVGSYSRVLNCNYSYCLTSFSTQLNGSSSGRLTNVKLSTSAINGLILAPGDTFDFDQVVGRRTPQRGYKEASVFTGSGVGTGYGGGVCQTSTTLFNAALRANLQIVERYQHTMKVSYINPGYDAAINWGTNDMKFRNNTKYNIKIVGRVANGKITFSLYTCEKVSLPKVTTSCSYNNGTYTMKRYANGKCNYTTRSRY